MWTAWKKAAPAIYERIYYRENPVISWVNRSGHELAERCFSANDRFSRVLEVGAGSGYHLGYVRHQFDEYVVTDQLDGLLQQAREKHSGRKGVVFDIQDATAMGYPDRSFDRLISMYNLEHLYRPHEVLREWKRVVRKAGVITVAIPAEGGVLWRLGRHLTTRRAFAKHDLDLDYIIAREHVNTCMTLVSLMRHAFGKCEEMWFPARVPSVDLNLLFICHARVS